MNIGITEGTRSLELEIKGYEFEYDKVDDGHDRNWLNIGVTYRDGELSRECTDPCILTWELGHIIEGLEEVLNGESSHFDEEVIWLLEPNIRFRIDRRQNGTFFLRVMFWNEGKLGTDIDEHILVRQEISSSELSRIIAKLRIGRKLYPER